MFDSVWSTSCVSSSRIFNPDNYLLSPVSPCRHASYRAQSTSLVNTSKLSEKKKRTKDNFIYSSLEIRGRHFIQNEEKKKREKGKKKENDFEKSM